MTNLTDKELIEEVKRKFEEKDKAMADLRVMNKKLEDTNQRLYDSEKMKSSFLSNLRNELNNPMATILGLCNELGSSGPCESERFRSIMDSLLYEAHSLDFQLENILEAAELESGEVSVETVRVDINSIVDQVLKNFVHFIKERGIIVKKSNTEPLWINSDPEKTKVIISNLVSNAINFNKDGGEVAIDLELMEDVLFLSVKDTGIGIPQDKLKVIFDRFVQLDKGTTKRYRGHGLGLSVSKAAANMLGGDIAVASSPGIGTRFTMMIPAHSKAKVSTVYVDGMELFEAGGGEEKEF